jgi:GT2 family glycosyltransferase
MPDSTIKLSIIIVNFKSKHCLKDCLVSIFNKIKTKTGTEIIIVNNDKEENLESLADNFEEIIIINADKNNGFGAANNLGAKRAKGEFLLFLNPDTEIFSENIQEIFEEFEKNENLAVIGSCLLDKSGKVQNWIAGKEMGLLDILGNNLGISRDKKIGEDWKKSKIGWVAGTAMFVRKNIFEKLQGFDENFFMYFEDMDLCKRARAFGKEVMYLPNFLVLHKSGESYRDKKKQKKDYYNSQEYYFKKHRGLVESNMIKFFRRMFFK